MPFLVLAGCATNANNAVYKKNLGHCSSGLSGACSGGLRYLDDVAPRRRCDMGRELWQREHDPGRGLEYFMLHTTRPLMELTVPTRAGYLVSTPSLWRRMAVCERTSIGKAQQLATGVAIDLRAYHYWNFEDGKVGR
jgi:hypothetical protein